MLKTHQTFNTSGNRTKQNEMTFSQGVNQRGNNYITQRDYDEDEEFYVIGDRVLVDNYRPGSVAYFGETEFGAGDWVGVVLDEPTGNHAGKLHGREYFQCAPNHGIFVRAHRVSQLDAKFRVGARGASRTPTPTPTYNQLLGGNRWWAGPVTPQPPSRCSSSKSPANSLLDWYYYDDDYRQDRGPSVASLALKLKSIDEKQRQQQQQQSDKSSTPVGILKHHNRSPPAAVCVDSARSRWGSRGSDSHSSGLGNSQHDLASSSISSRLDDLDRRLRASSVSPGATRRHRHSSMFSFRPKREPLDSDEQQIFAPFKHQTKHKSLDDNVSSSNNVNDALTTRGVNFSSELAKLGDRVCVRTERDERELTGVLRFMGETEFATGEWAGVELDERAGKNDGAILGVRYFECPHGYGLFVPASRVRKSTSGMSSGKQANSSFELREPSVSFESMRSTILSPPPPPPPIKATAGRRYDSSSATPSSCLASPSSWSSSGPSSCGSTSIGRSSRAPEADRDRWLRMSPTEPPLPPVRAYVSRATSISPLDRREPAALIERHYNRRAKFDDCDLERELARSSSIKADRLATCGRRLTKLDELAEGPRAKAVTYTFITNKLDGNPIAKRTLVYE